LLCLEKTHREHTIELTDEQIHLLERFHLEFRKRQIERQIEVHYAEERVAADTFFVDPLKGVGKVVLDCYSHYARCRCQVITRSVQIGINSVLWV